jgi:hypothetical protein
MAYTIKGVTLSYPVLFTPRLPPNARPGQKARYSCMALIPHEVDVQEVQAACYKLLKDKFGDKVDELLKHGMQGLPSGLRWPFRKDNMKRDGSKRFDETKYKFFISPWSETPPGLVDKHYGPDGKLVKLTSPDTSKLYPGCIVNISVNPFVYDNQGNRGVNLGLVAVQHWADGERLDNRVNPDDVFSGEALPTVDLAAVATATEHETTPSATGSKGSQLQDLFQ